jgi:hypothetical protein
MYSETTTSILFRKDISFRLHIINFQRFHTFKLKWMFGVHRISLYIQGPAKTVFTVSDHIYTNCHAKIIRYSTIITKTHTHIIFVV